MRGAKGYHAASEGSQGNHEGLGGSKMYHERPQRHGDEERRVRPHDLNQLLELGEHLLVVGSGNEGLRIEGWGLRVEG